MGLSKQQQKSLVRFLAGDKLDFTPSAELAAYMLDSYGDLLTWKGKKFIFSAQSKAKLKQIIQLHEPDLLMLPIEGQSRLGFSAVSKFEKSAPIKPESETVLFTHHEGRFDCIQTGARLPVGCSIRASFCAIQFSKVKNVVLVENLDIFDQWHKVNWPGKCDQTIAVYRGHERSISKGVRHFLAVLPPSVQVIAFCDYDPQGMKIALTLPRVSALLLPELQKTVLEKYNRIDLWKNQQAAVNFLRNHDLFGQIEPIKVLTDAHKPIALLQQAILANAVNLYTVKL
ncbi:DUF7281 domain-containing protein [Alteromonas sp. ASW11-130]|uniref:DUF7281 domain-containing protein n=1 Tax=Alteromonas sp. ASW11-130 TaxID=3015775 RepID=UPI002241E592|nr:hypothetical protein [Alteromonas sp. ASW11-130]MCW8091452.1 hypothetical protein [Alteromonas sp. ASW11-130]